MTIICFIQTRTKEEDKAIEEEANQDKVSTTKGKPGNKTSTTNKMLQMCEATHQVEGKAIMPDRAGRITPPIAYCGKFGHY